MALHNLIYASRAETIGYEEIEEILGKARENNAKASVTGMLLFANGYFLQLLEGERLTVSSTMFKIANDPRHREIDIIHSGPILKGSFSEWHMNYVPSRGNLSALYKPYLGSSVFEPFKLTADQAVQLCKEFAEAMELQNNQEA